MEFGSEFVYHYDDMEFEYISDEELDAGMNVRYVCKLTIKLLTK